MGILARFVENEARDHPSNPSESVIRAFSGGVETESGVTINESTALNISAVFACIRVISETLSSLPLNVYKRLQPRGRERAPDHPLYWLLHLQPNPEMTSMQWRETIAAHVVLRGNSYSEIEYDQRTGKIKALWPLRPDWMTVRRRGGRLWYYYQINGVDHMLANNQVLHVAGLGYDGIMGYSVVAKMREAMGLAQATEKFGSGFFGKGAKPSGVFTHPQALTPPAKKNLKDTVIEAIGGLSNSNRMLILEEGMKWEQIGLSQNDSQFLETRKFQLAEIARPFRVPLHLLQDLERATFSNIEHMGIDFVRHCIRPWAERHEQAYQIKLFRQEGRKVYFCKHLLDGLLRGDVKARYDSYKTGHSSGWLSANDIRELEDMNPIPKELGGDAYLVPLNTAPLSLVASGGAMAQMAQRFLRAKDNSDVLDADFHEVNLLGNNKEIRGRTERQKLASVFTPLFADAAQRIVNREAIAIRKALEKFLGARDASQFMVWLEEFYGKLEPHVLRSMQPVITSYSEAVLGVLSGELEITAEAYAAMDIFNAGLANGYTRRHIGSSLGQLREIVKQSSPQDVSGLIGVRLDEWIKNRPSKVAANEVVQVRNAATHEVFYRTGVTKKRWVAYAGACAFCISLNGVIVEIEAPFVRSGETIRPIDDTGNALTDDNEQPLEMMVHRSRLHPPIHRGCKCDIAPG